MTRCVRHADLEGGEETAELSQNGGRARRKGGKKVRVRRCRLESGLGEEGVWDVPGVQSGDTVEGD